MQACVHTCVYMDVFMGPKHAGLTISSCRCAWTCTQIHTRLRCAQACTHLHTRPRVHAYKCICVVVARVCVCVYHVNVGGCNVHRDSARMQVRESKASEGKGKLKGERERERERERRREREGERGREREKESERERKRERVRTFKKKTRHMYTRSPHNLPQHPVPSRRHYRVVVVR